MTSPGLKAAGPGRLALLGLALLALEGCATYSENLAPIRTTLLTGDVAAAKARFDKMPAGKDDLLRMLQGGYLDFLSGDWKDSNGEFDAAERRHQELYTVSLSNEAFALVTSDNSKPYRSNDLEMAMIPYYRIFNYVELGRWDDALVEARKANNQYPVDASQADQLTERDLRYKAFLNYYTGLLYAARGEDNDALVSLRAAYRLYRLGEGKFGLGMPQWLPADYYGEALHMGAEDEARSLPKAYPGLDGEVKENRRNNVVLFLESGFVPYRKGVDLFLPLLKKDDKAPAQTYVTSYGGHLYEYQTQPAKLDQVLRISFPKLASFPNAVASAQVLVPGSPILPAQKAMDLAVLTDLQFKKDTGDILLHTVLRALAKEAALKAAQGKNEGLGFLVNVFNVATEQADTRSWLLLPQRIDVAKARVAPGTRVIRVRFLDGSGKVLEEKEVPVDPQAKLQWVSVRCFK